jgi:membrane associated rhomboid family serine protease
MDQDPNASPLNPLPVIVWVLQAVERFGLFPELLRYQWETGGYPREELYRLISYPLVHANLTNTLFGVVFLLALGKMVGEIFRWWAVLVVVFGSAIAGAVVYSFGVPDLRTQLIGAFPPVYGLIGAFTFLLWVRLAGTGTNRFRAFSLIGGLLFFQLIFGLIFGAGWGWVAEVTGFATGFLLSFVVSPGGWALVMQKLRQR